MKYRNIFIILNVSLLLSLAIVTAVYQHGVYCSLINIVQLISGSPDNGFERTEAVNSLEFTELSAFAHRYNYSNTAILLTDPELFYGTESRLQQLVETFTAENTKKQVQLRLLFIALLGPLIFQLVMLRRAAVKKRQSAGSVAAIINTEREKTLTSISSYLHDTVLQDIGSLIITAGAEDDGIRTELSRIGRQIRDLSWAVKPVQIEKYGLEKSLVELLAGYEAKSAVRFDCSFGGYNDSLLSSDCMLSFYRIIQEAAANIIKHSESSKAELKVVVSHPFLLIRIIDYGKGFVPVHEDDDSEKHLGLALMKENAHAAGAELEITSVPGKGTTVTIKYSIKKRKYA